MSRMDGMAQLDATQPLALMDLHIHTLFRCDPDGRLRHINEPGDPVAPRFFMGRTRHGNSWRFRHDLPATVVSELDRLCRAEPVAVDLTSPPQQAAALHAVLRNHAPATREYRGPAYWIAEDTTPTVEAVLLSPDDGELLQGRFAWMRPLLRRPGIGPVAAVVEQGRVVTLCYCSRLPAQATEAGIETLDECRGKGYATAAVACWAAAVRRQGIVPLYSTTWDNLASQRVARKLRMVCYGDDWWVQ